MLQLTKSCNKQQLRSLRSLFHCPTTPVGPHSRCRARGKQDRARINPSSSVRSTFSHASVLTTAVVSSFFILECLLMIERAITPPTLGLQLRGPRYLRGPPPSALGFVTHHVQKPLRAMCDESSLAAWDKSCLSRPSQWRVEDDERETAGISYRQGIRQRTRSRRVSLHHFL